MDAARGVPAEPGTRLLEGLRKEASMALLAGTRTRVALAYAVVGPPVVAWALSMVRDEVSTANAALVPMTVVVAVAAQGSRLAGVVAAISAGMWFDFFFTEPRRSCGLIAALAVVWPRMVRCGPADEQAGTRLSRA